MSVERRGQVIRVPITLVNWQQEESTDRGEGRQLFMDDTSRVSREAQARICERLGVRFPGATRPSTEEIVESIRKHRATLALCQASAVYKLRYRPGTKCR